MPYENAERLSALDAMFLGIESSEVHMHIGSVSIFEAGPLREEDGSLAIERLEHSIESAVSYRPRLRQRIDYVPILGHPVWVDDERFNLRFHIRHISLPKPGTPRQLKRLAARIVSQSLDRSKPLWEIWFVDGLQGDRFAQIIKVHHCMADGAAGVDLMTALLSMSPETEPKPAKRWVASARPSGGRLLIDELVYRSTFPLAALKAGLSLANSPQRSLANLRQTMEGVNDFLLNGALPASRTPLNPKVGPYRRLDWLDVDLDRVKLIKNRLGGTVNDVVLAVVSGAMRTFLGSRGMDVDDLVFRAAAPVNVRRKGQHLKGNHVSSLILELPVGEADPVKRLSRVIKATTHAKSTHQEMTTEVLEDLSDRTFPGLLVQLGKAVPWLRPCNTIVTNVPGPNFPLYLLGAKLLEVYPCVPLLGNTGVAIALFSYNGRLFWGFNGEWDELPDLHDLTEAVETELAVMYAAAEKAPVKAPSSPRPRAKAKKEKRTAAKRASPGKAPSPRASAKKKKRAGPKRSSPVGARAARRRSAR